MLAYLELIKPAKHTIYRVDVYMCNTSLWYAAGSQWSEKCSRNLGQGQRWTTIGDESVYYIRPLSKANVQGGRRVPVEN